MHESTFPLLEDCSIAVFVHVGCLGHRRCTLLKKYSITYNCRLRLVAGSHQHRVPEKRGSSRCAAALSSAAACFGLPSLEAFLP